MNLNELTIVEAAEGLRAKKFTSVELTKACLARISERNKDVNAFITVCEDVALREAQEADEILERARKAVPASALLSFGEAKEARKATLLTGIPFCVKDAIDVKDVRSTGSAKILDNYTPAFDATTVARVRQAGAVLIGKTNCDAFGHGASNENSMYGPVRNPHDLTKVAGGSSGGAAAAVADNMCLFSIAEDTGGSIRLPASFCGVVGLRASYGRNSRYGAMPMASSFDTVGPMAKTIADLAIVQGVMAGRDERDATTMSDEVPDYFEEIKKYGNKEIAKLRVGVPKEYFELDGLDPEVKAVTEAKIKKLEDLGCKIVLVSLPHTKYGIAVYYILVPSEDSSNLARLDGIRYGAREEANTLFDVYAKSRAKGFPEEVKRRIFIGTYALSAGYFDAYYKKAAKVRTLIIKDFVEAFEKVDVILTPTVPYPAFGVGEKATDTLAMYLADVLEIPTSIVGLPGLNVPAGKNKAGLPIGVQIVGPRMSEELVMQVGNLL